MPRRPLHSEIATLVPTHAVLCRERGLRVDRRGGPEVTGALSAGAAARSAMGQGVEALACAAG